MKYRKRSIIYVLLAGLILLINSCKIKNPPRLELVEYKSLPTFPSASAIEFYKDKLYILGDDATYMLVMDTNYLVVDSVSYITDTSYRLSKDIKPDIEAATMVMNIDHPHLFAISSNSTDSRNKILYFPLEEKDSFLILEKSLTKEQREALPGLNIEGLTWVNSRFVLANRANTTFRRNKLFISNNTTNQTIIIPPSAIIDFVLDSQTVIGVSGLYYHHETDIMFFSASEEDTPSATQDGTINDSYLGWILNFSDKMDGKSVKPNQMIKLTPVDKRFTKQKIESVCVEKFKDNEFILHLVADNDTGTSGLFKMRLKL